MYAALRPLLFRMQPERIHHLTITALRLGGGNPVGRALIRLLFWAPEGPAVEAFGLRFPNPVGMAAGYDKEAYAWRGLAALGFGHVEVGTVTPRPQPGNPQPRIFRLVEDQAVINRMGFPNQGAQALLPRVRAARPYGAILGVNIGKNKTTPNEDALQDYLSLLRSFAPQADYLAVNVSSPNTPGLRNLQSRRELEGLLQPLAAERAQVTAQLGKPLPILVKLALDLDEAGLDDALEAIVHSGLDGVILNNTTLARSGLRSSRAAEQGGLSGLPLRARSQELTQRAVQWLAGRLPVVASGGMMTPADAQARLDAGAVLVQLYTGLIYAGPGLPRACVRAFQEHTAAR